MYQCRSCGGRLRFDIPSQQLKCEYCGTLYDPYSVEDGPAATEQSFYDVTVFSCPQCGGEIYSTDVTAAGFCSFCGASTILNRRLSKEQRPVEVIPFSQTKEDCKKAYSDALKHAFFAPKELKDETYIDGFRGIYMPYWVYHFTQKGPVSIPASVSYRRGDYIITDHYRLTGNLDASYDGLSYDASSSFADNISERIAPYNIFESKPFTPSYLSGFYADLSDVPPYVYSKTLKETTQKESFEKICSSREFGKYTINSTRSCLNDISQQESVKLTMFPVWFLSYRKKDRIAYATVNGQTGKVVLDIPVDLFKFSLGSFFLAMIIFVLLNLFFTPKPMVTLLISSVIAIITTIFYFIEMKNIRKRETLEDDKGAQIHRRFRSSSTHTSQLPAILSILSVIGAIAVFIINPVSDLYYYGACVCLLVIEFFLLLELVGKYNILSTRPLPQFNHKGGDDRA